MNEIPDMIHPLSSGWRQPSKNDILIDDTHALIEEKHFNKLHEYSHSIPTGVYDGKMWKSKGKGIWFLRWYGPHENPNRCTINTREIIII